MHKIETLPREIKYNGKYYFLNVHITAWGKLCVGYKIMDVREMEYVYILSNVICEKTQYSPQYNPLGINDIMDVDNFNDAVEMLEKRVNDALKFNYIERA